VKKGTRRLGYNFDKNMIKMARRECPQRGSANTHFHAEKSSNSR